MCVFYHSTQNFTECAHEVAVRPWQNCKVLRGVNGELGQVHDGSITKDVQDITARTSEKDYRLSSALLESLPNDQVKLPC